MSKWREVVLRVIPLEFEYVAREPLHLAEGKATNMIRGALGLSLKRQCCPPDCTDARHCSQSLCLYRQLFEGETVGSRPSGYREPPRLFVLRSPEWAARTVAPGDSFVVSVHLFDQRPEMLAILQSAFAQLGEEGLGPGRGRLTLLRASAPGMVSLDLAAVTGAPGRIRAEFLTPTEIKDRGEIVAEADFQPLFARVRERVNFLATLAYDSRPAPAVLDAARHVVTVRQNLRGVSVTRHSTRTGQTHPLAGFVGEAEYEGDFTHLWPWLKASEWTGVGRQTVWGKGTVRWSAIS